MSIESVEKLMEETAEAIEYQKEINEILQSRMTLDEEDAVQLELATMQREAAPVKIDAPLPHLPAVPTTEPEEAVRAEIPESGMGMLSNAQILVGEGGFVTTEPVPLAA